jgi:RNA polymerase sigma factor (sigma-70 family)
MELTVLSILAYACPRFANPQPFCLAARLFIQQKLKSHEIGIILTAVLAYKQAHIIDMDLHDLIEGCRLNDRAAQERLYAKFYPKMMSMVRRYLDFHRNHLAEEILNNGFLKVFQKIDSFKHEGSFEGWVRRIVYNSMADYMRQHVTYSDKTLFVEKDESVDSSVGSKLGYQDLMKLVQALPETSRTVFNMYAIEGYNHREIAEKLGMSEGTSKWHLFEARKMLRKKIEG